MQDVAVSVVGKYRYFMHSPAQHDSVPVIVDIILVGRTKIITLHSGIWLENRTDRRVSFRLHVPITPLVAPVAEAAPPGVQRGPSDFKTDATVGPLSPDEGAVNWLSFRRINQEIRLWPIVYCCLQSQSVMCSSLHASDAQS